LERIGVLALQGDFERHIKALEKVGASALEIRKAGDLDETTGLIIPGGESTTVSKLLRRYGLDRAIKERFEAGSLAIYGTCMGVIIVSREVRDYPELVRFGFLDIEVERNSYGPQVESFEAPVRVDAGGGPVVFNAVFIRAPRIVSAGPEVRILARYEDYPVLVSQGLCLGGTFHPELTDDGGIHSLFIESFAKKAKRRPA